MRSNFIENIQERKLALTDYIKHKQDIFNKGDNRIEEINSFSEVYAPQFRWLSIEGFGSREECHNINFTLKFETKQL